MTTRSAKRKAKASSDTVTVTVVAPHLVYFDGEQRGGTLHDVPADTADYWHKHGWVTIAEPDKEPEPPAAKSAE